MRKGVQMNIEVPILAVAILLLVALAYGKDLFVSLAMLFRASRQNEDAVRSADRNDSAASRSKWPLQDS
jgi:hypothetical protein